ncbi:MAG: hypothetical protein RBG13Loki_3935 [Promethearchaeota archaeon CR_4]|nr:MAG: hypothetical protein RBG13Loki_3935 [Candidatus Lokiarchaeota archaeon CR_4]
MDRVYMRDNIVKSSLGRDKTALNYLFELPSKWANQSKELLMLSIIFADRVISDFQEDQVRTKLINFVHNLKENKEIFKGLYFHDRLHFQIPLRRQILATNTTLQKLVDNFQRSLDIELDVALFKEP